MADKVKQEWMLNKFLEITKKWGLVPIGGKNYGWVYEFTEVIRKDEREKLVEALQKYRISEINKHHIKGLRHDGEIFWLSQEDWQTLKGES